MGRMKLDLDKINLAWFDFQTTGLDHAYGEILEVGLIVTDWTGTVERTRAPRSSNVIAPKPGVTASMMRQSPSVSGTVREMHDKSGLWEELEGYHATPLASVDSDLANALLDVGVEGYIPIMAGNNLTWKRAWLESHLPGCASSLSFKSLDVNSIYTVFDILDPEVVAALDKERTYRTGPTLKRQIRRWAKTWERVAARYPNAMSKIPPTYHYPMATPPPKPFLTSSPHIVVSPHSGITGASTSSTGFAGMSISGSFMDEIAYSGEIDETVEPEETDTTDTTETDDLEENESDTD